MFTRRPTPCAIATTALLACAGQALAETPSPRTSGLLDQTPVRIGGEVYASASGDLVLIPEGAVRQNLMPAGASTPLWLVSSDFCVGGSPGGASPLFRLDGIVGTDAHTPGDTFFTGELGDAGDLPFDSLVCGMRIFAGTTEPTPDTDGDGIPETSAQTLVSIDFYDNDNRFGSRLSGGVQVASFDLPIFGDPTPADSYITGFYYTWDFASDFVDNSGNPIDASFTLANSGQATDLDGDGLGDFGYAQSYLFADADGDGEADLFETYVVLAAPEGDYDACEINPPPGCVPTIDATPPHGTGTASRLDVYSTEPLGAGTPSYLGTITGFGVDPCPDGAAYLQLGIELFTQDDAVCCPSDQNGDGQFNNTDINLFVQNFIAQTPGSCGGGDMNGDGSFNNTDINLFVTLFLTQCS